MKELDKIIEDNETVFWEGKPNFWPFTLSGVLISLTVGLIFLIIGIYIFSSIFEIIDDKLTPFLISLPFLFVGIIFGIFIPCYRILLYRRTYYAITNKRVLFQTGIIGRDFEILDFDKISNAQVNVGIFDKLFSKSSGSILLSSSGDYSTTVYSYLPIGRTLSNIPHPYEVFKFFKKVSYDVKTDIEFPNQYRPRRNPGYKTAYKPK